MTQQEEEREFIQKACEASDEVMRRFAELLVKSQVFKDYALKQMPTTGKVQ